MGAAAKFGWFRTLKNFGTELPHAHVLTRTPNLPYPSNKGENLVPNVPFDAALAGCAPPEVPDWAKSGVNIVKPGPSYQVGRDSRTCLGL